MAQRIFSILVVWFLLLGGETFAQDAQAQNQLQNPSFSTECNNLGYFSRYHKSRFSLPLKKMIKNRSAFDNGESLNGLKLIFNKNNIYHNSVLLPSSHFGFTTDFMVRNYSFFCKNEYQFEKATGIALRVRLGSLDYVNRLERKY